MIQKYRGYPIPEIIQVDEYYWIVDDRFGEHKGYREDIALMYWKLRVDVELKEDAVAVGLADTHDSETLICRECGSLIGNIAIHLEWHRKH